MTKHLSTTVNIQQSPKWDQDLRVEVVLTDPAPSTEASKVGYQLLFSLTAHWSLRLVSIHAYDATVNPYGGQFLDDHPANWFCIDPGLPAESQELLLQVDTAQVTRVLMNYLSVNYVLSTVDKGDGLLPMLQLTPSQDL